MGYSPRGGKESNTTEQLHFHFSLSCTGEGNATHSSVLAWRVTWTEKPSALQSMGHKESDMTEGLSTHVIKITVKYIL